MKHFLSKPILSYSHCCRAFFIGYLQLTLVLFIVCSRQDDSHGSEFYIGIMESGYDSSQEPSGSFDLHIATTSTDILIFHIEGTNGTFYNGAVTLNEPTTVTLDSSYRVSDSTYSNRNKGIRVYTEDGGLISILAVIYRHGSVSDYAAYPYQELNVADYVYYTVSTGTKNQAYHTLVLLIGAADDTTVTVTPSQTIVMPRDTQSSDSTHYTLQAGTSRTVTLNRLQTLLLKADNADLTGSKIVSDKPLTVLSGAGHECSNVSISCEATSVEVLPTATWGTKFLITPLKGHTRLGLNVHVQYYKMVAAEPNTIITLSCNNRASNVHVLGGGGAYLTFITYSRTYCYAESDKPIFTIIFGHSTSSSDPVVSLVPSVESYARDDILFYIPSYSDFDTYHINIMSTEFNPGVLMDGQALSLSWTTINDTNGVPAGYAAQMSLLEVGVDHYVSSDAPITALVYGWGNYSGFSYAVGVNFLKTSKSCM